MRDDEDTMDNWDEDKLKEVVEKKHGEGDKQRPTTDIVSYQIVHVKSSRVTQWVVSLLKASFIKFYLK